MSVPPELLAQLQGGEQGGDPLQVLQEVIQMLPSVMAVLPDPRDTQDVVKALLILTGVQTRLMSGGPQQGQ